VRDGCAQPLSRAIESRIRDCYSAARATRTALTAMALADSIAGAAGAANGIRSNLRAARRLEGVSWESASVHGGRQSNLVPNTSRCSSYLPLRQLADSPQRHRAIRRAADGVTGGLNGSKIPAQQALLSLEVDPVESIGECAHSSAKVGKGNLQRRPFDGSRISSSTHRAKRNVPVIAESRVPKSRGDADDVEAQPVEQRAFGSRSRYSHSNRYPLLPESQFRLGEPGAKPFALSRLIAVVSSEPNKARLGAKLWTGRAVSASRKRSRLQCLQSVESNCSGR